MGFIFIGGLRFRIWGFLLFLKWGRHVLDLKDIFRQISHLLFYGIPIITVKTIVADQYFHVHESPTLS